MPTRISVGSRGHGSFRRGRHWGRSRRAGRGNHACACRIAGRLAGEGERAGRSCVDSCVLSRFSGIGCRRRIARASRPALPQPQPRAVWRNPDAGARLGLYLGPGHKCAVRRRSAIGALPSCKRPSGRSGLSARSEGCAAGDRGARVPASRHGAAPLVAKVARLRERDTLAGSRLGHRLSGGGAALASRQLSASASSGRRRPFGPQRVARARRRG
jgi:hypothetical protein